MSILQNKIESIINDQANFNELTLTNSTISINSNSNDIKLSGFVFFEILDFLLYFKLDPVVGEFQSKNSFLLSNSKPSLKSDSASIFFEINDKKKKPLSEEQKLIQSYSKIKFIKDDDYYIKKYPIYFPNYPANEYQAYPEQYTEPYYPQEYNEYAEPKYQPEYKEKYDKKTEKYDKYSKESYGHKKPEDKKKHKPKLKEDKPILKKETEILKSNKTVTDLKEEKTNNEIIDINDSDQSFQDSVEETTRKQIEEKIEEKIQEINDIGISSKNKENSKTNNKEKIDLVEIDKKLENTDNISEKIVKEEEPKLSTQELSEKQKNN